VHERYRRQTTDRRQTDRQTDGRQHIANVNVSSRSLTKPRLLLVELSTPDNAKELRRSAARLRYSNDESARSVYINADLSPAEAKLSYEHRERRRRRTIQTADSIASTTDSLTTTLSETATHSSNCDKA